MIYDPYISVKNLHEGSPKPITKGCDSWKEYWEHETGRKFSDCSCYGCGNKAEHGSHVIKTNSDDKKWYIVPLCAKCNNHYNEDAFKVRKIDLVPLNN